MKHFILAASSCRLQINMKDVDEFEYQTEKLKIFCYDAYAQQHCILTQAVLQCLEESNLWNVIKLIPLLSNLQLKYDERKRAF